MKQFLCVFTAIFDHYAPHPPRPKGSPTPIPTLFLKQVRITGGKIRRQKKDGSYTETYVVAEHVWVRDGKPFQFQALNVALEPGDKVSFTGNFYRFNEKSFPDNPHNVDIFKVQKLKNKTARVERGKVKRLKALKIKAERRFS